MNTNDQAEAIIKDAVRRAKKKGLSLITGTYGVRVFASGKKKGKWGNEGTCLCPLGCVLVGTKANLAKFGKQILNASGDQLGDAAKLLKKPTEFAFGFTAGFDGLGLLSQRQTERARDQKSGYRMGARLRRELLEVAR